MKGFLKSLNENETFHEDQRGSSIDLHDLHGEVGASLLLDPIDQQVNSLEKVMEEKKNIKKRKRKKERKRRKEKKKRKTWSM